MKKLSFENEFNQPSLKPLIDDINLQKTQLKDKEHILETINLSNKLEKLVKDKFFKDLETTAIEIVCDYDYQDGYRIRIPSVHTIGGFTEDANSTQVEFFEEFFSNISEHDSDFISKELMDGSTLELNSNVAENLTNLLLSPRLKTILDYNKMKAELSDNNGKNTKKVKI